jgi:hypothetical protein
MELLEVGKVKAVLKSTQVQLENGQVFILDNIRIPVPYEQSARELLTDIITGKTVGFYANKTLPIEGQADEHGNEKIHAVLEDGTWVQQKMVEAGLAWADSGPNNRDCVANLYKAEIVARAKKKGFWAAPDYKIHDANHVNGTLGTFILFEGLPKVYRSYGEWDYFGFGYGQSQTQRSFTIGLKREDAYRFQSFAVDSTRHGFSAADMAHTRMRIRGWVETLNYGNGGQTPMIRLTHPEQIEWPDGPPVIK